MHYQPKEAGDDCCASPAASKDLSAQAIVLRHVLEVFPGRMTIPGLVRELTRGSVTFAETDAFERAVRDLTGVGLLRCPSGVVEPTRVALYFHELPEA